MRPLLAALAGAAVTTIAARTLAQVRWTHRGDWVRTNYRDQQVSLAGGLATATGAVATAAAAPATTRSRAGAALGVAGAAVFGLIDDQAHDPAAARGLKGHLRALREGRITTGTVKLFGIPATALAAAACLTGDRPATHAGGAARTLDLLLGGALIAGTANLVNLFDLRPGRALKAGTLPALLLQPAGGSAAALGAAAAGVIAGSCPGDLTERTMLGDTGANALGALLGTGLALLPAAAARAGALGAVVALIVLSEKVSFSAVIDRSPVLHRIDAWGRPQ